MELQKLKDTIDKLEFLKTKSKSICEAANIDTKIEILKRKLNKRYDD